MGMGIHAAVHDIVEELAILGVLHDHEDDIGCLYDLVELCDGGVAYKFEDVEFAGDSLDVGDVFDFVFLEDFDGDGLLGGDVGGFFDLAEGAFADGRSAWGRGYRMW